MTITYELDLHTFEAWSGAKSTLERVIAEGKTNELEAVLEDCYPEGMTETQLNDVLWFESDWIFEMCGIRTESEIREELEEAKEELEEMYAEWRNQNAEEAEENDIPYESADYIILGSKIWEEEYSKDAEKLRDKIAELTEELENI